MNSLANMYQGGMNNNYGSPDIPRKQFDVQPPVQNPQFGQNGQQNGYDKPQFGGGHNDIPPQQPIRNPQNVPHNFQNPVFGGFEQQNTPFAQNFKAQQGFNQLNPQAGQFPRFDAWRQEHPNFGRMFNGQQQNWWQRPQIGQPSTDQGYNERGIPRTSW